MSACTRVKVCGLTRPEDIEAANRLRPDYVGFVFAESRRRLTPEEAARLKQLLRPDIRAVGVFVNENPRRIAELAAQRVIDLAQLHGDEDGDYIAALRALCDLPLIKAVGVGERVSPIPPGADFLLFDSLPGSAAPEQPPRPEADGGAGQVPPLSGARGGTGRCFDWSLVEPLREQPFFLGGGIGPDNVAEAIARLRPFAVDASSSLETGGKKDPEKMRAFIERVRRLDT